MPNDLPRKELRHNEDHTKLVFPMSKQREKICHDRWAFVQEVKFLSKHRTEYRIQREESNSYAKILRDQMKRLANSAMNRGRETK